MKPKSAEAFYRSACSKTNVKEKLGLLEQGLEINPNHVRSLCSWARNLRVLANLKDGWSTAEIGYLERSVEAYDRAMKLWPKNSGIRKEYEEVKEELRKAKSYVYEPRKG
jgi:hypothetical protein